ncbi:MAG: hypothetical protein MJA82_06285 [Clostridia bacterium]|nr:hypothetical protein [Clostridia bacterium]
MLKNLFIVFGVLSAYVIMFIIMCLIIYAFTWLPAFKDFFHDKKYEN